MLLKCVSVMLMVVVVCRCEADEYEPALRPARFSARGPVEVSRCLRGALQVGCGAFSCLEHSACNSEGMTEVCNAFLNTAAVFNTEGKTFVKESIKCMVKGISSRDLQSVQHCSTFQQMISEVQEDCYRKLDVCTVARSNAEVIGDVVQVPKHFPNRFYSTLLQSLMKCDEETVEVVRSGLLAKLDPDMETFIQLIQKKQCLVEGDTDGQDSFPWALRPPAFRIQPNLHNRDPTHLFAKKR